MFETINKLKEKSGISSNRRVEEGSILVNHISNTTFKDVKRETAASKAYKPELKVLTASPLSVLKSCRHLSNYEEILISHPGLLSTVMKNMK